jgi:hypothetical protein
LIGQLVKLIKLWSKKVLPNPVHHSTIQKNKNTTKYHPQNEESDHPKNLAKDQEMKKMYKKRKL